MRKAVHRAALPAFLCCQVGATTGSFRMSRCRKSTMYHRGDREEAAQALGEPKKYSNVPV